MKQVTAEDLKIGDAFQNLSGWGKQPKPVWWIIGVYPGSVLAKAYVRCTNGVWVRTTRIFLQKALMARYTIVNRGSLSDALQVAKQTAEGNQQT